MFWNVKFIYNAFIRTTVVVVGLLLIMLNGTLNANLLILLC